MQKRIASERGHIKLISKLGEEWADAHVLPGWTPREGYVLTVVRAISARVNQNFDGFPGEELRKSAHTFVGKPIFVNHHNEDPLLARGVVVASRYVEAGDDKYIEVIQETDSRAYPKLAKEIIEGGLDSVSMGCEAGFTICSACDNKATDLTDMCDHVLYHKGSTFPRKVGNKIENVLVYEKCYKIGFFELSYVFDPADETAVVSRVLTAKRKQAYGEVEAPKEVDTLRKDQEAEDDGYHHYIDSPDVLSDPDLDEAKRIDRAQDEDPDAAIDEDSQEDPTFDDDPSVAMEGTDDPIELEDNISDAAEGRDVPTREQLLEDLADEEYPEDRQPIVENTFIDGTEDPRGGQDMRFLEPHRERHESSWRAGKSTGDSYLSLPGGAFAMTSGKRLDETGMFLWTANNGQGTATSGQELTLREARRKAEGAAIVSNDPSTRNKSYNQTTRSSAMARQTLATRGQATRRVADVRNDQGVNDKSGEFISETPGSESASGRNQLTPDEHQDVSSDANPKRTDPGANRSAKAKRDREVRAFREFAEWLQKTWDVNVRTAAMDNKLRGLVEEYVKSQNKSAALLMPGMKAVLREASRAKSAIWDEHGEDSAPVGPEDEGGHEEGGYDEAPEGHGEPDGDEGGHYDDFVEGEDPYAIEDARDVDLEDAPIDPFVEELEHAAEDESNEDYHEDMGHDGDEPLHPEDVIHEARRSAPRRQQARRAPAQARRRVADNMAWAKPEDRVDVTKPVSDTNPPKSQESQYDTGDFGHNAGDDIAKPDLGTGQNWAPGDGKKTRSSARITLASGVQAVRLAHLYVEAGLAHTEQVWKLAEQFEKTPRSVVLDRTALLEQVAKAGARKTAGGVTRSSTRPVIPQNFGSGSAPRIAAATATTNDIADDVYLHM